MIDDEIQLQEQNSPEIYVRKPSVPNSTAVLVLGIVSICTCYTWGIVGLICGIISLALHKGSMAIYKENPDKYALSSFNNLNSGRICAIIGISLSACMFLVLVGYFATFFTMMFSAIGASAR